MRTSVPDSWQDVDGHCQFCHSRQDVEERKLTAMTALQILLVLIPFVVAGFATWALLRWVSSSDWAARPPRNVRNDDWGADLPSVPYAALR
jgi:hypothetical protein